MDVNRSGYYKWRNRQINKPEWIKRRESNLKIIQEVHNHHKTHGYRWISAYLKQKYRLILKPNYVHVCCKYAGINLKHLELNGEGTRKKNLNSQTSCVEIGMHQNHMKSSCQI